MIRKMTPSLRNVSGALALCASIGFGISVAQAAGPVLPDEIKIGYSNEPPFSFSNPDGSTSGESPEVTKAIFKLLGVKKVTSVVTDWGSLIPGLNAGRFDVIASGMYITPARCKQVIFTDPEFQIADKLLVSKGNPKNLHSYQDFAKNPDTKLAMTISSVYIKYAHDAGLKDSQIIQVPDANAQLQAVRSNRVDAAISTQLTIDIIAKKGGDKVEVVKDFKDDPSHIGYGALAFRPQDKDLRDAVNVQLKKWLKSEEHLKAVEPFGFNESNFTDKTAAELCGNS